MTIDPEPASLSANRGRTEDTSLAAVGEPGNVDAPPEPAPEAFPPTPSPPGFETCRVCANAGTTTPVSTRMASPAHWVEPDLCSACQDGGQVP